MSLLPPDFTYADLEDRPPYRGPNWPFILILAAYAAFFAWLLVR